MRNSHPRYMCFPSVVCVGRQTEVTIFPKDISRYFRQDREYELRIVGLRDDQLSYFTTDAEPVSFEIVGGCMRFRYTFDREQEYSLRFKDNNGRDIKVPMYAVEEDLYSLRPLKGDLHTHSYYSDGQDGIAMTPADYREEGFDFFSLTDHNRMFSSQMARKLYDDVNLGMTILNGEEVHTPGSILHIVNVGSSESVCSLYLKDPEGYEKAVSEIEQTLPHIPELYRRRTAMAKWACDNIHRYGGIAIFAHPFWCPNKYNISEDFCKILFDEIPFDAFELMGGIGDKNNNLQLSLWLEQLRSGKNIPTVGSSDSHNHSFENENLSRRFTVAFAKSNCAEDIIDAVKNGWCVAGKHNLKNDVSVEFYGDKLRLVAFSHFLYENYFSETAKLCMCEGVLMRRYAEGENVGEQLSSLADTVENFYKKFYGLCPAETLGEDRLSFLEECLHLQRTEAPNTCGSSTVIYHKNYNRE